MAEGEGGNLMSVGSTSVDNAFTEVASLREDLDRRPRTGQESALVTVPSPDPKWRVLIAHPGRQHSHQAALALHEVGYLHCYATGIPVSKRQFGRLAQQVLKRYSVHDELDIPLQLTRLNMITPIVHRLLARNLPEHVGSPLLYETYRLFDKWVAKLVAQQQPHAVIAYEASASYTFEAARKVGAACILDAAALHRIEADQRFQGRLPRAYKRVVDRRKDTEIALADCIFTTSNLAAQSYLANVPSSVRIRSIALGADIDRFKPTVEKVGLVSELQPFCFIFVGTATRLKGFDLLIEAHEQLIDEKLSFKMVLVGDVDASLLRGHPRVIEMISQHGRVGQTELASILRSADCLILPSRFDSFGMVVPEAMACGLPVIVSDMVGAKELVADGRNGFIVPAENISALVTRMRWMIHNRKFSREMSLEARAAAEQASWACYRRRFVATVRELLLSR